MKDKMEKESEGLDFLKVDVYYDFKLDRDFNILPITDDRYKVRAA
jgi:hypothetical protein